MQLFVKTVNRDGFYKHIPLKMMFLAWLGQGAVNAKDVSKLKVGT